MEIEEDIRAEGAEIIWVLEQNQYFQAGTAEDCRSIVEFYGSTEGWCVGDSETQPVAGAFDESPFSVQRGFDMIVPRDTMQVVYTTSHGTTSGNDNPTAEDVLDAVRAAAAR